MFQDVLLKLPYMIALIGLESEYKMVNNRYANFLNTKKKDIIGKKVSEFIDKEVYESIIKKNIVTVLSGVEVTFTVKLNLGDLKDRSVSMRYIPFIENDTITGFIAHGEDLTKKIKIKNNLKLNRIYLESIFESNPNIMFTTNGIEIDKSNQAMLDFVNYKTLGEFKKTNDCLANFFVNIKGFISSECDGEHWITYISDRKYKKHKVAMYDRFGELNYFNVQVNKLEFDDLDRSIVVFTDITNEYKAKNELIHSQSELSQIIDGSPIATFVIDKNHRVTHWNKACELLTSVPCSEMIEKNDYSQAFYDKKRPTIVDLVIENRSEEEIKKYYNNQNTKSPSRNNLFKAEAFFEDLGQKGKWLSFSAIPIYDKDGEIQSGIEMLIDITELKTFQEQLVNNEKVLKDILDVTLSGYWDWNIKEDTKYLSPGLKAMFGYEDSEIENSPNSLDEIIFEEDLVVLEEVLKQHISSKGKIPFYSEVRYKHKNGSTVWVISAGQVIQWDLEGKPVRMTGCHVDITHIKQLEENLKKQEEIMMAQSKHAAMGEMISMIAHQWRQPLSIISMGANNILADIELDMLQNDILKDGAIEIIEQTKELSNTIDDFKNFFRPEKGVEYVTCKSVFEEALKVVGKSLENNDVSITQKYNTDIEIQTYSRELMQVFINIIKNAKEALVEKNIQNKEINIFVEKRSQDIEIIVRDNAGGIPKDIINQIFNPYFTTKDEHNGTGLGLYMSKTIIEKHLNGTINVEVTDIYTSFIINLPVIIKEGK